MYKIQLILGFTILFISLCLFVANIFGYANGNGFVNTILNTLVGILGALFIIEALEEE